MLKHCKDLSDGRHFNLVVLNHQHQSLLLLQPQFIAQFQIARWM
jgi:hypothetical protein